MKVNNSEV